MPTLIEQFHSARDASVPLLGIQTPDIDSTVKNIGQSLGGQNVAMVLWDCVRGMMPVNKPAGEQLVKALKAPRKENGEDVYDDFTDPLVMLKRCREFPAEAILFMANLNRLWENVQIAQAIWNLRDVYKANGRMLLILGQVMKLPGELANDVLLFNEPLPDDKQMEALVLATYHSAKKDTPELKDPDKNTIQRCVDAVCGLAAFPAEQRLAMSIRKSGMDIDSLQEGKRQQVEQTQGLKIYRGDQTFAGLGGCENMKEFFRRIMNGRDRPRAIVFQDEIEKQYAGAAGDLSGTTQELLGSQLTFMQDNNSTGILEIGHAGVAKTDIVKAFANEAQIPLLQLDLGQAKGSLIGESNQNMAMILKVIEAVSRGRALWAGTCNDIKAIPVELRRRYTFGTFFFDLPKPSVRNSIWEIYFKKFGLTPKDRGEKPADSGWTGAEIKNCCLLAYRLNIPLKEAAKYVVPISVSAKERIIELRRDADGRYISADDPGVYKAPPDMEPEQEDVTVAVAVMKGTRKITPGEGSGGTSGGGGKSVN